MRTLVYLPSSFGDLFAERRLDMTNMLTFTNFPKQCLPAILLVTSTIGQWFTSMLHSLHHPATIFEGL